RNEYLMVHGDVLLSNRTRTTAASCHGHPVHGKAWDRQMVVVWLSVRRRAQRARDDEMFEPSFVGREHTPVVAGKINHNESRGRKAFVQALTCRHIACGDEEARRFVDARIVPDHEEGAAPAAPDQGENSICT